MGADPGQTAIGRTGAATEALAERLEGSRSALAADRLQLAEAAD